MRNLNREFISFHLHIAIGVILSADEDGYVVGTKSGRVKGKMARSQIEAINFSGLKDTDVPDKELG